MSDKKTPRKHRNWYDFIVPFIGIKWGAHVTLIAYSVIYQRNNEGMLAAAGIAGLFLVIEWTQLAWKEFKGTYDKNE